MRWVFVMVVGCLCSWSCAQPDSLSLFGSRRLDEALEQGAREHRFVVVYPRGARASGVYRSPAGGALKVAAAITDPFELMEKNTWTNRTLRGYLAWKAIPVMIVKEDHPDEWAMIKERVPLNPATGKPIEESPVVVIFKDGEIWRTVPDDRFMDPVSKKIDFMRDVEKHRFYVKPLEILRVFETGLGKLEATDPLWYFRHMRDNPMPGAPVRRLLFDAGDGLGAPVEEPVGLDPRHVAERLTEARALTRRGGLHDATGLYTWLWERGEAHEPSLGHCRWWLLGGEMRALAGRRDASRERFGAMLRELDTRELWFSDREMLEYFVLCEISQRDDLKVDAISAYLLDDTEASLIPPSTRAVFDLLTARDSWVPDPAPTAGRLAWLEGLAGALERGEAPARVTAAQWGQLQGLRRLVLLSETTRLYALAMRAGDADLVAKAGALARRAGRLWAAEGEADTERSLAFGAVALGCDDPSLRRVLAETGGDPFGPSGAGGGSDDPSRSGAQTQPGPP